MEPAAKTATYEDLLGLPEDVRGEILSGEVVVHPSPLPEHGWVQGSVARGIGGPFDGDDGRGGPGGWWILIEVDVRLGVHDIARPDVSGLRRTNLPKPFGSRPIDVRPDWVCEVLSPTNASVDRVRKRTLYADYRVPYYWMIDPGARVVEALKLVDGAWVEIGAWSAAGTARIEPFDAVELDLERLFPPLV